MESEFFDFDELDALEKDSNSCQTATVCRDAQVSRLSCKIFDRKERRHFLTFGNGVYASSAIRIAGEVRSLGDLFEDLHVFTDLPDLITQDSRWSRHIADGGKGFGWCFWKPALVNYLLRCNSIEEGDLLVYGDAGCTVPQGSVSAWQQLFKRFDGPQGVDLVAFHNDQLENRRTKGDTFATFGVQCDSEYFGLTCQLVGGYWICRINSRTRQLFAKWEDLCADVHLISDDKSDAFNPYFIENRHDQSLLSMLVKSSIPPPVFIRSDRAHFNAARMPRDSSPSVWRDFSQASTQDVKGTCKCGGVEGLNAVVLKDCGWPVTCSPGQPIAATRLCSGSVNLLDDSMFGD